jgi:hypothetical protein
MWSWNRIGAWRMASSRMWCRVNLVWTDVSEVCITSIFRVEKSVVCSHLLKPVPRSRIFLPWRWRRYVPPKRRFTQDKHDATSKKTAFFIVTAVKTSNLTQDTSLIRKGRINCIYNNLDKASFEIRWDSGHTSKSKKRYILGAYVVFFDEVISIALTRHS